MPPTNEDRAAHALAETRAHSRRRWNWENWIHPELAGLSCHERNGLLERAQTEATSSFHIVWQAALIATATLFLLFMLQRTLGPAAAGVGAALGFSGIAAMKQIRLYRAIRSEIHRIQIMRLAERGEA